LRTGFAKVGEAGATFESGHSTVGGGRSKHFETCAGIVAPRSPGLVGIVSFDGGKVEF
jgi:hypothetical protein